LLWVVSTLVSSERGGSMSSGISTNGVWHPLGIDAVKSGSGDLGAELRIDCERNSGDMIKS
jgi:hypothetical protein